MYIVQYILFIYIQYTYLHLTNHSFLQTWVKTKKFYRVVLIIITVLETVLIIRTNVLRTVLIIRYEAFSPHICRRRLQ